MAGGMKQHGCAQPGCTEKGIIRVEDDKWLCAAHINARVNSPENIALNSAMEELGRVLINAGHWLALGPWQCGSPRPDANASDQGGTST
jgi:hypothetical protein